MERIRTVARSGRFFTCLLCCSAKNEVLFFARFLDFSREMTTDLTDLPSITLYPFFLLLGFTYSMPSPTSEPPPLNWSTGIVSKRRIK